MRRLLVSSLLVSLSALLACGSLKGADPTDAPPGDGPADTGAGDGGSSGALDGGPGADAAGDGGRPPSTGNGDPRWVQGKVPGDAPAPTDFVIANGADGALVTDTRTGLVWQDTIPGTNLSWKNAVAYCDTLVYSGFADWRVPTRWEMITVLAIAPSGAGTLVPGTFSKPPGGGSTYAAWTSSVFVDSPTDTVWAISATGTVTKATESSGPVRCVRDGVDPNGALPAPKAPLYDLSDANVVRDLTTGLVWERTAPAADVSLADATSRCQALALAGHTARLPTVKELASLVDETKYQPALAGAFGNAVGRVHTSNPGWLVDFTNGTILYGVSAGPRGSRCVAAP